MLVTLDTPYADTTAGDLSHLLGGAERSALHVLELALPGARTRLALRLLGASHQVVLDAPAGRLVETVACLPGRPARLPRSVADDASGYHFAARVRRLAAPEFSARVRRLSLRLSTDARSLVGIFPGDRDAVTALSVRTTPAGVRWRTWHAYPQSGELVETESAVRMR